MILVIGTGPVCAAICKAKLGKKVGIVERNGSSAVSAPTPARPSKIPARSRPVPLRISPAKPVRRQLSRQAGHHHDGPDLPPTTSSRA